MNRLLRSGYLQAAIALSMASHIADRAAEEAKPAAHKKSRKERRADARMDAKELKRLAKETLKEKPCPECGMLEKHWIVDDNKLMNSEGGFWTCPKFYGPDGRRIDA